jgi:hypothetical protein
VVLVSDEVAALRDALVDVCVGLEKLCAVLDPEGTRRRRDEAANDLGWNLLLMMGLGLLDIPMGERKWLGEPAALWSDLAFACREVEGDRG